MNQRGQVNLHLLLTIFLGVGMVLFGALAVYAYMEREDAVNNLNVKVKAAVTKSVEAQKKQDAEVNRKANDLPYRVYTADQLDGAFQLQIPKSWSLVANKNSDPSTQLEILSNPNVVVNNMAQNAINTQGFKMLLLKKSQTEVIKNYDALVKQKKVTSKAAQVSGINATRFEGQIDNQRHTGVAIVFPVRDKTVVMITENMNYKDEFEKIVTSAKINP